MSTVKQQVQFELTGEKAEKVYSFVRMYGDYMATAKDYGTGQMINMVEAHTLECICDTPGITVTRLAELLNRTKGTVSATVSKLENSGYIYKEDHLKDAKIHLLYPTDKGLELDRCHKAYDDKVLKITECELLDLCHPSDLDGFFRVISAYIQLLRQ